MEELGRCDGNKVLSVSRARLTASAFSALIHTGSRLPPW